MTLFPLGGIALSLWGWAELSRDAEVPDGGGLHNARSRAEVDAILVEARAS